MNSRVFVNTFSQAVSRGLVVLVSVLTTSLLTRFFGAAGYGDYIFVTSLVLLFVGLSDLGTTIIGVREASANKSRAKNIFSHVLGLRLSLSCGLFLLFNCLIFLIPQFAGLKLAAAMASLVIPFLVLRTTTEAVLQTYLRLDLASLLEISASAFFLLFILVMAFVNALVSLPYLMLVWVFSALFSGIIGWFLANHYLTLGLSFKKESLVPLVKEALPLGIYLLVYSIYDRGVDSFILKIFSGSEAVGFYGLAYKIHGNLVLGAAFLMNSLFPLLAGEKEHFAFLKKTYHKAFSFLFSAGLLVSLFFFFLAGPAIRFIAGSSFNQSVFILRLLLGATFFSYLNHLTGYLLVTLGEQKTLLKYSLLALFLNLFLNIIFIPRFSFFAAAVITVLTEGTLFFLTQGFLKQKYGLNCALAVFWKNLKLLVINKEKFFNDDQ